MPAHSTLHLRMSDNTDIGAFFSQQKKKKQKQKKQPKESGSSLTKPEQEETKKEEELQKQPKHAQQQDFAESSDEEKNEIELDDAAKAIKDKKEVDAQKRKQEEKSNDNFGWGALGSNVNKTNDPAREDKLKAPVSGSGAGIKFGRPTFSKANNPINKMDFPELGAAGTAVQKN